MKRFLLAICALAASALCYGQSYPVLDNEKIDSLTEKMNQGDLGSQVELANYYFKICMDSTDIVKSAPLYKDAADKGNVEAKAMWIRCILYGVGVEKDTALAFSLAKDLADTGCPEGQTVLGACYSNMGDYEAAFQCCKLAAYQGYYWAQRNLGTMYYHGDGVAQNYSESAKWYRFAAEQGDEHAQYILGMMYDNGYGVDQDFSEAAKWYRLAAEQGYAKAQYFIGSMYYAGEGVEEDIAEAIKWLRLSAEQGYLDAQYTLGMFYFDEEDVEEDIAEAIKWFKLAAENGDVDAQEILGQIYEYGEGVDVDELEAAKWYALAEGESVEEYCFSRGDLYYYNPFDQDFDNAFKWFKLAADLGNPEGQLFIGKMYANGEGVDQDYIEAAKWFKLAAEQGNEEAQFYLGEMYEYGEGVDVDMLEAAKWYALAIGQSAEEYCYELGLLFSQNPFDQDLEEAIKWFKLAADLGHEGAAAMIEELSKDVNVQDGKLHE